MLRGFESHTLRQKENHPLGGSLFGCKVGFERAAEQSEVSNCSGNSCLARGRESLSRKCGCSRAQRESVPELTNILCRSEPERALSVKKTVR